MDSVDRILYATHNLLCVLEQEDSLLENAYFLQKLTYLRAKHKETLDFLAKLKRDHEEHLQKQVEKAVVSNTNEFIRAITNSTEPRNLSNFQRINSQNITDHVEEVKLKRQYSSTSQLLRFPNYRSKSTHELREYNANLAASNDKVNLKPGSTQHFIPQITRPHLFKMNVRSNTTSCSRTNSASTYPGNKDQIHTEEGNTKTRNTRVFLPVPVSTYVAPIIPKYRRAKSANKRAVDMLVEASTPPGLQEHKIRTTISSQLRHFQCKYGQALKGESGFQHT